MRTYLRNTESSPFFLPKQLQRSLGTIEIIGWDLLKHVLGELDMAVFKLVVGVSTDA